MPFRLLTAAITGAWAVIIAQTFGLASGTVINILGFAGIVAGVMGITELRHRAESRLPAGSRLPAPSDSASRSRPEGALK